MAANLQNLFWIWKKNQTIRNQIHLLKIGEKEKKPMQNTAKIYISFTKSCFLRRFLIQIKLSLIISLAKLRKRANSVKVKLPKMRSKTLWETWFETQHSETMVLLVNFTELFGLNSNLLWYYLIEDSSLEN